MKTVRRSVIAGVAVVATCALKPVEGRRLSVVSAAGHTTWSGDIKVGERFELTFSHSQEGCRWTQEYRVTADQSIEQVSSMYPCFGAGAPIETGGRRLLRTEHGYTMADSRQMRQIHMMNSRQAGITLVYREREIALSDRMAEYEVFDLRVDLHK